MFFWNICCLGRRMVLLGPAVLLRLYCVSACVFPQYLNRTSGGLDHK